MQPYTEEFFQGNSEWARSAAQEIVPLVIEMFRPRSVVDVGCGAGSWLAAFQRHGVVEIQGVDGDYVSRAQLEISPEQFRPFDLTKPLHLDRQFDLVVSLEVAEHLPPEAAQTFVRSLTRLGPAVLFSAAIPGQGGVNHLNEQWPDYWARLFRAEGYEPVDWLRKRIWQNGRVEWYYAQNSITYARPDYIAAHPALRREYERTAPAQLSLVHPAQYLETLAWVDRVCQTAQELSAHIPATDTFILVDEAQLEGLVTAGRRYVPFPEVDGEYGGPPDNDAAALAELERLREAGSGYIVFAWPAHWWLDYYESFHSHLRRAHRCIVESERVVIFDLRA